MPAASDVRPAADGAGGIRASLPLILAGFAISFVVVGGGIDTVSVFLNAIDRTEGWSRSMLSLAIGTGAVMAAVSTPLVGAAVDRFGVRVPIAAGVLFLAGGFAIVMRMTEPWHFVGANVLLGVGFAACALLPITIAITVCVPHRTGLALGIAGAGSSAGALVLAPAVQAMIDVVGWRDTYFFLGSAVVLTPLPCLLWALPRGKLRRAAGAVVLPPSTLGRDLRRPGVLPLAAVMVLPGLAMFSISVHLVPYLTGIGHAATVAALALGVMVGVSAVGKVAGGFVADRIGVLRALRWALIVDAVALALLPSAASAAMLGAFVVLHGVTVGTQIAVVPAVAISIFGAERFGTLFGLLQLAAMLASAVGPVASGVIFDSTGHYGMALVMWAAAMVIAAAISFGMRPASRAMVADVPPVAA